MERHDLFDEWLDEVCEPYAIGSLTYLASDILAECDPVAYGISVSEWRGDHCEECGNDFDSVERCDTYSEQCRECCALIMDHDHDGEVSE